MWQQMAPLTKRIRLYSYLHSLSHSFKPNSLATQPTREIKAQLETARWGYKKGIPAFIRGPCQFCPVQKIAVIPLLLVSPQKRLLK